VVLLGLLLAFTPFPLLVLPAGVLMVLAAVHADVRPDRFTAGRGSAPHPPPAAGC